MKKSNTSLSISTKLNLKKNSAEENSPGSNLKSKKKDKTRESIKENSKSKKDNRDKDKNIEERNVQSFDPPVSTREMKKKFETDKVLNIETEPKGISNRLTDYVNDKLGNIVFDHMSSGYKQINLYNNSIYYMQKIWIRTPILKIFRSLYLPNDKIKNSVPLNLLLTTSIKQISQLHTFIKRVELKATQIIKTITNNQKLKLLSSLKNYENFPPVFVTSMPFTKVNDSYEFNFHIYNKKNKRIGIESVKKGIETEVFLELSHIWYNDINYGCSWNVVQMRMYPEIIFGECLFEDSDEEDINEKECDNRKEECYHCLFCPNNHIRTAYIPQNSFIPHTPIPIPPPPPPRLGTYTKSVNSEKIVTKNEKQAKTFTLTLTDLLSVKLKPLEKPTQLVEQKTEDHNINILNCKDNLK